MLMSLPFLLIYFALSALLVRTDIRTGCFPINSFARCYGQACSTS